MADTSVSSDLRRESKSFAMWLLFFWWVINLQLAAAKISGHTSLVSVQRGSRRRLQLPDFMCSIFGDMLNSLCGSGESGGDETSSAGVNSTNASTCPSIRPLSNDTGAFDIDRFTQYTWFVQEQQINGFQYSPDDEFFCLTMTYTRRENGSASQNINSTENDNGFVDDDIEGGDVTVFYNFENYGVTGGVNGSIHEWDGDNTNQWCAGQDRYGGGLLRLSPCTLHPLLVRVGIPQWVIAVDTEEYAWAIMSGGEASQPVVGPEELIDVDASLVEVFGGAEEDKEAKTKEGQSVLCTTRTDITEGVLLDTGGSGLWILTRERVASPEMISEMKQTLVRMGISTEKLFPVVQEGCTYADATLVEKNEK